MGCAVAEALSLARDGLHPRVGLKLFGRNPLQYQFQPGTGITSHRTHALLMTCQAILRSKVDPNHMNRDVRNRIAWYQRAFPFRHLYIHGSRFSNNLRQLKFDDSMTVGLADDPHIRSMVLSVALQGCVDSASTWFQLTAEISHGDSRALQSTVLVGFAAQLAQLVEQSEFDSFKILEKLNDVTEDPKLRSALSIMDGALKDKQSVASFAKQMGWENGLPDDLFATAVIGVYAWLRHPKRFRNCVERTILLGGACSGAATVAGGLSGISLGKKGIPTEWLQKVSIAPHSSEWREKLIERIKDWPHGAEDIGQTVGLPSSVVGQVARNLLFSTFKVIHGLIRLPMRLSQFSVTKRYKFPSQKEPS